MFSKGWKWLYLAPLTVSLLTACGDRKHPAPASGSRFSGLWLNAQARADFRESKGDIRLFCARVEMNRRAHGLPPRESMGNRRCSRENQKIRLQAWNIEPSGAVNYWASNTRVDVGPQANPYRIGRLNESGRFTADRYEGQYGMGFTPDDRPNYTVDVWTLSSRVSLHAPQNTPPQLVFHVPVAQGQASQSFRYQRVLEPELQNYATMLEECTGLPVADPAGRFAISVHPVCEQTAWWGPMGPAPVPVTGMAFQPGQPSFPADPYAGQYGPQQQPPQQQLPPK